MAKSLREYRRDSLRSNLNKVEVKNILNSLEWGTAIETYGKDSAQARRHAIQHDRLWDRKRGLQRRLKEVQEELITLGRYET